MRTSNWLLGLIILLSLPASAQVLNAWDVNTLTGYGPSPYGPTTEAANITSSGWTRAAGVATSGTAANYAWGGTGFALTTDAATAIAGNDYVFFTITANSGYTVSFSEIPTFRYRHSGTGPDSALLQYSVGGGSYSDIVGFSFPSTSSSGANAIPLPVDLSTITDLQAVPAGTTITFRLVLLGATNSGGTWYIFNQTGDDFVINGFTTPDGCTTPDDVPSITATATGSTTATLNWTSATCYDEYLIVAAEGGSVSAGSPSGDGTAYTADADFSGSGSALLGGKVVYKGTALTADITGLSPGTDYCFKIFTRKGTNWSAGVEDCITTLNPTVYNPGEMVFVGYDTNLGSGTDKFSIAVMEDMTPGTSFILANMVYEYRAAAYESTGLWYNGNGDLTNSPGFVEITYIGSTVINAGSVICVELSDASANIVNAVFVDGTDASSDFIDDGGGHVNVSSTAGNPDAMWLMQGTFSDTFFDSGDSVRTFVGSVLGGIQFRSSFQPFSADGDAGGSRVSRIHPDIRCIGIDITTDASAFYGYYNSGAPHTGSARYILGNIIDVASNWTISTGGASTDELGTTCSTTFTITGSLEPGIWLGDADDDWFNCSNWDNYQVPDASIDVIISSTAINDCYIDDASPYASFYDFNALCNNLQIENGLSLEVADASDSLLVGGSVVIESGGSLLNEHSGLIAVDGDLQIDAGGFLSLYFSFLELKGDYANLSSAADFDETISFITLLGSADQTISTSGFEEQFFYLIINKPTGQVNLSNDLAISDGLVFASSTLINTFANTLYINSIFSATISGYGTNAYVNGNLKRDVSAGATYTFPVGTAAQYEEAVIQITSAVGLNNITVSFDPTDPVGPVGLFSEGPVVDGIVTPVIDFLNYGYWNIDPDAVTSVTYSITLTSRGHTNAAPYLDFHGIFKNSNALSATGWVEPGVVADLPPLITSPTDPVTVTNFGATSFSDFAIGFSELYPLPIVLTNFSADNQKEEVILHWTTSSEINNDHFTVERSGDGVYFEPVGTVAGAGNSNTALHYQLTDDEPLPGTSYYRLKQTDFDGQHTWSEIVPVQRLTGSVELTVYPNPAHDILYIPAVAGTVSIFAADGQLVWQATGNGQMQVQVSDWAHGTYMMRITQSSGTTEQMFLVQ